MDGDDPIDLGDTSLSPVFIRYRSANNLQISENGSGNFETLYSTGGTYEDREFHFQVDAAGTLVTLGASAIEAGGSAANRIRWTLTSQQRTDLQSLDEDSRFILFLTEPVVLSPLEATTPVVEGGLVGEASTGASLGEAPAPASDLEADTPIVEGGLTGSISAEATLGSTQPLSANASAIGGLLGMPTSGATLDALSSIGGEAFISGGLAGIASASAELGTAMSISADASVTGGLLGTLSASASFEDDPVTPVTPVVPVVPVDSGTGITENFPRSGIRPQNAPREWDQSEEDQFRSDFARQVEARLDPSVEETLSAVGDVLVTKNDLGTTPSLRIVYSPGVGAIHLEVPILPDPLPDDYDRAAGGPAGMLLEPAADDVDTVGVKTFDELAEDGGSLTYTPGDELDDMSTEGDLEPGEVRGEYRVFQTGETTSTFIWAGVLYSSAVSPGIVEDGYESSTLMDLGHVFGILNVRPRPLNFGDLVWRIDDGDWNVGDTIPNDLDEIISIDQTQDADGYNYRVARPAVGSDEVRVITFAVRTGENPDYKYVVQKAIVIPEDVDLTKIHVRYESTPTDDTDDNPEGTLLCVVQMA